MPNPLWSLFRGADEAAARETRAGADVDLRARAEEQREAARAPDPLGFHSTLFTALADEPMNAGVPNAWRNRFRRFGVTDDELRVSGIEDIFREAGENTVIPRETLLENARRVELREARATSRGGATEDQIYERRRELENRRAAAERRLDEARGHGDEDDVNLIEMELEDIGYAFDELAETPRRAQFQDYTVPGGENYREVALAVDEPIEGASFEGAHFGGSGVVAHMRTTDRVINGKRTLYVEEVQSDLFQQRRDVLEVSNLPQRVAVLQRDLLARYADNEAAQRLIRETVDRRGVIRQDEVRAAGLIDDPMFRDLRARVLDQERPAQSMPPAAPFEQSWPEMALRRAIRIASEEGYDQVAIAGPEAARIAQKHGEVSEGIRAFYGTQLPRSLRKVARDLGLQPEQAEMRWPAPLDQVTSLSEDTGRAVLVEPPTSAPVTVLSLTPEARASVSAEGFKMFSVLGVGAAGTIAALSGTEEAEASPIGRAIGRIVGLPANEAEQAARAFRREYREAFAEARRLQTPEQRNAADEGFAHGLEGRRDRRQRQPEGQTRDAYDIGYQIGRIQAQRRSGEPATTPGTASQRDLQLRREFQSAWLAAGGAGALGVGAAREGGGEAAARETDDAEEIAAAARRGERVELLPDGGARITVTATPPSPPPPTSGRWAGMAFAPRERPRYENIVAEQWDASLDLFTWVYADNARQRAVAYGFDEQDRAIEELTGERPPDPFPSTGFEDGTLTIGFVPGRMLSNLVSPLAERAGMETPQQTFERLLAEREAWLVERGLGAAFTTRQALDIGLRRITDAERRMIEVASVPSEDGGERVARVGAGFAAAFAGGFQDPFQAATYAIPGGGGTTRLMAAGRNAALNAAVAGGVEFTLQQDAQALREEAGLERENIARLVGIAVGAGGLLGGALGAAGFRRPGREAPATPAESVEQAVDDMITALTGLKEAGLLDEAAARTLDDLEAARAVMRERPDDASPQEHMAAAHEALDRAARSEPDAPEPAPRMRATDDDAFDDPFGDGAKAQTDELARELDVRARAAEEPSEAPPPARAEPSEAPKERRRVRLPSGREAAVDDLFLPDGTFDSAAVVSGRAARELDRLVSEAEALRAGASTGPGRRPERLRDWVVRQGGVKDRGGDVVHAAGEEALRVRTVRGPDGRFSRRGAVVDPENGLDMDDLALRAWEEGWFPHLPSRPHLNELIEALGDDIDDRVPVIHPRDADLAERLETREGFARELDELGLDPTADPRRLRADLAEAFGLVPEGFTPPARPVRGVVEDFGDLVPVERADERGGVRYDTAPTAQGDAQAQRAQFFVQRFKDCVT